SLWLSTSNSVSSCGQNTFSGKLLHDKWSAQFTFTVLLIFGLIFIRIIYGWEQLFASTRIIETKVTGCFAIDKTHGFDSANGPGRTFWTVTKIILTATGNSFVILHIPEWTATSMKTSQVFAFLGFSGLALTLLLWLLMFKLFQRRVWTR